MEKKNEVVKLEDVAENKLTEAVQNRVHELVQEGRLDLPKNYSVGNAMSSAYLILQNTVDKDKRPVLEVCDRKSIINSLLNMAILGLNPAKQQGYFIAYGKQLSWFTSYFGMQAAIQRLKGYEGLPSATLIYEGDEVTLSHDEYGEEFVSEHLSSWENKLKGKITGAYASIKFDGRHRYQVMTMNEIKESWSMSKTDKNHDKFTGEFAKRTVLNRLLKNILKTSTDDDLVAEKMISTENEQYDYDKNGEVVETVKQSVEQGTASQEAPLADDDSKEGKPLKGQESLFPEDKPAFE